jgi:hypothetical protein
MTGIQVADVAVQLRLAFESMDLELLAPLLHPDVRWGDGPEPRACRSKADVLVTFARLLGDGVDGAVIDVIVLPDGVVIGHQVTWPPGHDPDRRAVVWQSFRVQDGLVTEISGHDDREDAQDYLG